MENNKNINEIQKVENQRMLREEALDIIRRVAAETKGGR